ncbi:SprT family protein [Guptibacillus algicola]|uniref:SprT family protein n=1 Tax=Guptibacillus algicola TaxID=225844 RepID=UPI001CD49299|nr:SprT family protein [Alkalihalobacillus algicola]MCA0989478.1 SprT family protein [Alkalihalobacillus algicola]
MDNEMLQSMVEKISIESFGIPFAHEATFNPLLRTTGGRYLLRSHNLQFNPKHYDEYGLDELTGIIKHELCHYHLHIQGKGYKHRDRDFKVLLNRVGGSRYCQAVPNQRRTEKVKHFYQCSKCEASYKRKRRIDTSRFVCGKCKGKLFKTS